MCTDEIFIRKKPFFPPKEEGTNCIMKNQTMKWTKVHVPAMWTEQNTETDLIETTVWKSEKNHSSKQSTQQIYINQLFKVFFWLCFFFVRRSFSDSACLKKFQFPTLAFACIYNKNNKWDKKKLRIGKGFFAFCHRKWHRILSR